MRFVRLSLPLAVICVCVTTATASFAQSTVVLDATSGTGTISTNHTTTGGLTLNLGFFADYLVVGGGGGGGGATSSLRGAGGGGAGGIVQGKSNLSAINYSVLVGAGGAGGANSTTNASRQGQTGTNSAFGSFTATGGGGGGAGGDNSQFAGSTGGSGGGAGGGGGSSMPGAAGGSGSSGQGTNGGASVNNTSSNPNGASNNRWAGGGGGGAGSAGSNGDQAPGNGGNATGGDGGAGTASLISGSSVIYAGGGGGGAVATATLGTPTNTAGTGGAGGGGNGGSGNSGSSGANGVNGLGGGGGGAASSGTGGNGGSGRVIVRYQGASLGNIGGTVTTGSGSAAGYTIHTFTTTGSSNFDMSGVNLGNRLGATLTGTIFGTGGLTYAGPGTLTLTAANTYSGPTVIRGGTLAVGAGGSIAQSGTTLVVGGNLAGSASANGLSGALVINGGNVSARNVYIANSQTNPRSSTGLVTVASGTLLAAGDLGVGTVPLNGNSWYVGGTGTLNVLNGGVVDVRGVFISGTNASVSVNAGGTLKVGGSVLRTTGTSAATNDGTIVFDGTNSQTFSGSLTGTGAVIKSGGRLSVQGALGSTGGLTISSGTVVVMRDYINTGAIAGDVANNGVFEFATRGSDLTFAGSISGSGQLISSGYYTSLTLTGSNTFTGLTSVLTPFGTLSVGNGGASGSLAGGVLLSNNALVFNRSDESTYGGDITGNGSLTKLGAGALTLTGSSTFTGQTTVSSGTLILGSGNALGSSSAVVVASGATLQATQPVRIGYIDSSGTVLGSENLSATLTVTNSGLIGGIANGTDSQGTFVAGIVKLSSGTSTVNAVNTYTGRTWVRAGTLATGVADAFAAASDLTVESGASFDRGGFSQTFANADVNGTVGNAGEGGGLLTVTGTLSGSGVVNGATLVNGFHAPGNSPGVQTFNDDLTYGNAAAIGWELIDNTQSNSPVVYDQVVLTGLSDLAFSGANVLSLSFNGAGSLVNWNDTFWDVNRVWTVFDLASGVTTGFNNLSLGGSLFDSNGLLLDGATRGSFSLAQSGQDVVLQFTAVPEPSTLVLLAVGGAGVAFTLRRRKRA